MNNKRPRWDSKKDLEEDSDIEEEDDDLASDLEKLRVSSRELLEECRKLNELLSQALPLLRTQFKSK